MPVGFLTRGGSLLPVCFSGKQPVTGQLIRDTILANDIITQLQARNGAIRQAIAVTAHSTASTLHTPQLLSKQKHRLTQQLANPPFAGRER